MATASVKYDTSLNFGLLLRFNPTPPFFFILSHLPPAANFFEKKFDKKLYGASRGLIGVPSLVLFAGEASAR